VLLSTSWPKSAPGLLTSEGYTASPLAWMKAESFVTYCPKGDAEASVP